MPARRSGRLTARQKRLLQLVFDQFDATAAWPSVARLQHALARQGDQFDVRSAAINLDRSFGLADVQSPNGEAVLTVKGVRRCRGADHQLDIFAHAVQYFVKRYAEAPEPPAKVSSAELQRDLELSASDIRKLRLLTASSLVPMAGGGGTDDEWTWQIDDRILPLRNAVTIDQLIRKLFPPGWPYLRPVQQTGAPGAIVDWRISAPGWEDVDFRLSELREGVAGAATLDDWQDVGRRSREILIAAAKVVFRPRHVAPGAPVPGPTDAKAQLGAYFAARAPDLAEEMRAFVNATWKLANALTHNPRMERVEAFASAQAVHLVVRLLQELQRAPLRRRRRTVDRRERR